jgi:DNA repair exonuclease SbcCD nuclease subunit
MPTFLHSADWQIGKPYARVHDPDKRARLRQVRLEAIDRIGAHIAADPPQNAAAALLVAGDLFDSPTPSASDVSAVCAAIGALPIPVLVIPGNHDHGAPGSVWHGAFFREECQRRAPNLQVLLERRPLLLEEAVILPCPLLRRSDSADPSGWLRQLDWASLPTDRPRLVLAHGSVQGFGATDLDPAGDGDEENPRHEGNRLRLEGDWLNEVDYIALGDWHGLKHVPPKAWYAGTPEPDRFPRSEDYSAGQVLRVTVERGGTPEVLTCATGALQWHPLQFHCNDDDDLNRLERQLDTLLDHRVGHDLLRLELSGSLSLAGQQRCGALLERLEAQLLRLKQRGACAIAPSPDELETLTQRPGDPLVALVAQQLHQQLISSQAAPDATDPDREAVIRLALSDLHRHVEALS